jgi:transposase
VDVPWGRKGSGFTLLFEALIVVLVREMPVNAVVRLVGEHDARIWRVLNHHVEEARAKLDFSSFKTICLDEKSYKRGQSCVTFFMDLDLRRLVFGTDGKDSGTLATFVEDLKAHQGTAEQIRDVCCDISPAFIKGIQAHLPNAEITLDRFHWLRNPGDPTKSQKARLKELKAMNLHTVEAYQMKLLLQDFFEQPDRRAGSAFLNDWCTMAQPDQQWAHRGHP